MMTYESGNQIGDYLLLSRLGRGRTSEVWTALRDEGEQPVGLKVLLDLDAARAEREVRILRAIDPYYSRDAIDYRAGDTHFTFPLTQGRDVATALRERGPLPPTEALQIIGSAAAYLARAHERGYVHGDLKPAHLIYLPDLTTRVVDWGDARETLGSLDNSISLRSQTFIGTLPYLSPEQREGELPTHKTDVWQLGVILHECLTGKRAKAPDEVGTGDVRGVAPSTLRFIKNRMLPSDSRRRMTMSGVSRAIPLKVLADQCEYTRPTRRGSYVVASKTAEAREASLQETQESSDYELSAAAIATSRLVGGLAAGLLFGYLGLSTTIEQTRTQEPRAGFAQTQEEAPLDYVWLPPRVAREEDIWRDHTSA